MKSKIFAFVFAMSMFFGGFSTLEASQNDKCVALWKIQKQGIPTSYLVGTVHINYTNKELSPCLNEALKNSKTLFTESAIPVDEEEILTPESLHFIGLLVNPQNPNQLKSQIGEKLYKNLKIFIEKINPDFLAMYDFMYDWSLNLVLSTTYTSENMSPENGIDFLLSKKAKQDGIKRLTLENMGVAVDIFKSLPKDKIIQSLETMLKYEKQGKVEMIKLVDAYNKGDMKALEKMVFSDEMLKFIPTKDHAFWKKWLMKDLLDNRTIAWVPKILENIANEPTLIAVGVAHTLGENGLVNILRQNGYELTVVE